MHIRQALLLARARIGAASESASADAARLLGHVLAVERAWLLAHPEAPLAPEQAEAFFALVERAAAGEPLPYLLGRWPFYDRDFLVTPAVLIPRPETELLVELALARLGDQPLAVADVGTGSGAIAVTVAALRPRARVTAVDISEAALAVARANAEHHGAPVAFVQGDLLAPLLQAGMMPGLVLANLPYIPTDEVGRLAVSQHEPWLALDGGADGLRLIARLLAQAAAFARPPALLLEIMSGQAAAVAALAEAHLPGARVTTTRDYGGHERVVEIVPG